jgi:hypothetical protein
MVMKNSRRPKTEEEKRAISEKLKGRKFGEKHKERLKQSALDYYSNSEARQKLSERMLTAKRPPDATCTHCGLVADIGNIKRWHGDNCIANIMDEALVTHEPASDEPTNSPYHQQPRGDTKATGGH